MPTKIEWATDSWSPVTGCTPISEGCANCYAKRMARRFAGRYGYPKDDPFKVTFHPDQIEKPLKWKNPRRIFVCSMGELFHPAVDPWWIDDILDVCLAAPQHTYMFLTKRPENIRLKLAGAAGRQLEFMATKAWIGVTAENQKRADERIPILLTIPAAVRFVSVEPMLSAVKLDFIQVHDDEVGASAVWPLSGRRTDMGRPCKPTGKLDWAICGAETGPKKCPMDLDWARSLRDQCVSVGVPFFFKKDSSGNHELDGRVWEEFPK